MVRILCLLIGMIALAHPRAARASPPTPVLYEVAPVVESGQLTSLAVKLTFEADESGVTTLRLPDGYGSGRDFWKNVRDLEVSGARVVDTSEPGLRKLQARGGRRIAVRYRIVSPLSGEPRIEDASTYQPVIRPRWFYAVGSALFALPYARDDAPARFVWNGGRIGMPAASDLQADRGEFGSLSGAITLRDVRNSALVGGWDLSIIRSGVVRVASIGAFRFDMAEAAQLSERIVTAQTAFWGDRPRPFLITIVPHHASSPLSTSWQGTGRSGGFATRLTPNVELRDLTFFFAHENFHRWNSSALGGQGSDGRPGFWFSEGFTDFFALRLMVRSGVMSPHDFADVWNGMLAAYAASPARTLPNGEIAARFWTDPHAKRMAYQRGALLAALWDWKIRRERGGALSLDDLLRAQRRAVAARDPSDQTPAFVLFPKIAAAHDVDLTADIARYLDRGEPIELPADVFGPCATVQWREQPDYDRGWDVAATSRAGGVVTGLREGSPAWRAGLRNGMRLLERIAGRPEDSSVEAAVRARAGDGTEQIYRFKPEGRGRVSLQHMTLTDLGAGPRCREPGAGF